MNGTTEYGSANMENVHEAANDSGFDDMSSIWASTAIGSPRRAEDKPALRPDA